MSSLFSFAVAAMAAAATQTDQPSAGKPILIVLTSHGVKGDTGQPTGFYLGEATHPLAVFEAAGQKVEFASVQGGEPPVDGLDLKDPINARYWNDEGFRIAIRTTPSVASIDPSRYAAVLYAGGHGTVWDFPDNADVQRIGREIYEAGGVVGAVCHGPSALVNLKLSDGHYLVEGRQVAAFTDDEERAMKLDEVVPFLLATTLQERDATHLPAGNWQVQVVTDGRLVTGQNPQSAQAVGEAMLAALRKTASA